MPRFLLMIDGDAPLDEWLARGLASGVVQAHAALGPAQLRVVREGGVPLAVQRPSPSALVLFEAEDAPSALVWVASCPGHGSLRLFCLGGGDWQQLACAMRG